MTEELGPGWPTTDWGAAKMRRMEPQQGYPSTDWGAAKYHRIEMQRRLDELRRY